MFVGGVLLRQREDSGLIPHSLFIPRHITSDYYRHLAFRTISFFSINGTQGGGRTHNFWFLKPATLPIGLPGYTYVTTPSLMIIRAITLLRHFSHLTLFCLIHFLTVPLKNHGMVRAVVPSWHHSRTILFFLLFFSLMIPRRISHQWVESEAEPPQLRAN